MPIRINKSVDTVGVIFHTILTDIATRAEINIAIEINILFLLDDIVLAFCQDIAIEINIYLVSCFVSYFR